MDIGILNASNCTTMQQISTEQAQITARQVILGYSNIRDIRKRDTMELMTRVSEQKSDKIMNFMHLDRFLYGFIYGNLCIPDLFLQALQDDIQLIDQLQVLRLLNFEMILNCNRHT